MIAKLFDLGIYGIGTVRQNRKMMPKLPGDKSMKRGDIYQYSEKVICVKWKDNRGVVLVGSNIDGADDSSSVQRREKGNSSKTSFPCPHLVKSYNKGMEGVDLLDQFTSTYRLGRNSNNRYYLCLFLICGTWL